MIAVDFGEVNASLDIEEVAGYLGIEVKKHFCRCPFHNEKTPSMKLYGDSYHCFGCGASGDSINLTSKLFGIRPIEAVSILNDTFHLGYDLKRKATHKQARMKNAKKRRRDLFKQWHRASVLLLSDYIQTCYDVMNDKASQPWMIERSEEEAERTELLQDTLFELSPQDAYTLYRGEVAQIDKRIQRRKELIAESRIPD